MRGLKTIAHLSDLKQPKIVPFATNWITRSRKKQQNLVLIGATQDSLTNDVCQTIRYFINDSTIINVEVLRFIQFYNCWPNYTASSSTPHTIIHVRQSVMFIFSSLTDKCYLSNGHDIKTKNSSIVVRVNKWFTYVRTIFYFPTIQYNPGVALDTSLHLIS